MSLSGIIKILFTYRSFMFLRLIGGLFMLFQPLSLNAQNVQIWKAELGRAIFGEYGMIYEKKIFGRNKIPTHNGYYEREMYLSGRTPQQARMSPPRKAYEFLFNAKKKFYTLSGGYFNHDYTSRRELHEGIFGQLQVKRYFSEEPPHGFYVAVGIRYQIYISRTYNEYYETLLSGTTHRPSLLLPILGWQHILGYKNTFAIDACIGADWGYKYQVQPEPFYQFQTISNLRIFWGLSVGFVRYKQRSIW